MHGSKRWGSAAGALLVLGTYSGCDVASDPIEGIVAPDAGSSVADGGVAAAPAVTEPALGVQKTTRSVSGAAQLATQTGALAIPGGALDGATEITVAELSAGDIAAPLPAVLTPLAAPTAFTPHGLTFATPVTISLFYQGGRAQNLVVLRLDDEADTTWELVHAEFNGGVATFQSTHFSVYSVSECDPANDPKGYCSQLLSGVKDLDDLPADEFVPYASPDAGADESGDAGVDTPEDAEVPELDAGAPDLDAGTEDPGTEDAGKQDEDAGGPGASSDAALDGDAGVVGCDWVEVCKEVTLCERPASATGGTDAGAGAAICPPDTVPVVKRECRVEPKCTDAWCAIHPSDCGPRDVDGGVDGGVTPPPQCYEVERCEPRMVCPGDVPSDAGVSAPDAGAAADAGITVKGEITPTDDGAVAAPDAASDDAGASACPLKEVCEPAPCGEPPVCSDVCKPITVCDAIGNCKTEDLCMPSCTPSPSCPPPVCTLVEICPPPPACTAAEMVQIDVCWRDKVCEPAGGVGPDAAAPALDAGAPAFDCSTLAVCREVLAKCSAAVPEPRCDECAKLVASCGG